MKVTIALLGCISIALADDMGVARKVSENKFAPLPGLPACATLAVESGDPSKGASVIRLGGLCDSLALAHANRAGHGRERIGKSGDERYRTDFLSLREGTR